MEPAYKLLSVEEFLDCCPNDQRHYQLLDGIIDARAPYTTAQQIIASSLIYEIQRAVRPNLSNATVRFQAGIAPQGRLGHNYFETDITVTCEKGGYRSIAAEPLLIVEILSPSTERDDIFLKLPQYRSIPSVREILYIESERVAATIHRRGAEGWETIEISGSEARLQLVTIGLDVALGDIYRGVPRIAD